MIGKGVKELRNIKDRDNSQCGNGSVFDMALYLHPSGLCLCSSQAVFH